MRTLSQIALDNYLDHTERDLAIMEVARSEAVAELTRMVRESDPKLAEKVYERFWKENPRGR